MIAWGLHVPFYFEHELRARHPRGVIARLSPYTSYYWSNEPREDQPPFPTTLFVVDNEDVEATYVRIAARMMLSSMDSEEDATGYSQRKAYDTVFEELRKKLAEALKKGSKRLLATYLQTLLAYPDGCTRGETVFDPGSGNIIVQVPPLSEGKLYPKEKALLDLVAAERMARRRGLVYVTHTGTKDVTERMDDFLTRHGFRVAVMKADAVAPDRREAWVADRVKQGVDVLICHPRLVQTGLDLVDFPTICWAETDYSVYVMRQASRRSWRIGQTRLVKVVFMSYRNTLQADALKLVAKKLQSSLAVEVNGNGHHADIGPTVELVLGNGRHPNGSGNGHAPAPVNGNGHHDEAPEPQQSLFSWAEFMAEEPVKPKGRGRKPQPAATSLFEWALEMEQEREEEPVGAGR